MMSEVIVAIISASILIPQEKMYLVQWFGAFAIIFAGLYEVIFSKKKI
jgi:drug/metabolite transporter (DMT)-like permease|tara:strand:+ start:137 stop:280 length:144 start_codon:yes stop_codon:yes gene_type:complete